MKILKPLGDGIGTGAGVAWPSFGILFSILGLSTGGTLAITLGSVFVGTFLLVAIPTAYWSHRNYSQNQKARLAELTQEETKLAESILNYLLNIARNLQIQNLYRHDLLKHLKSEIQQDLNLISDISPYLSNALTLILNDDKSFILNQFISYIDGPSTNREASSINHDQIMNEIKSYYQEQILDKSNTQGQPSISASLTGFWGAFGSIAGCSAGGFGLLASIGVFAGFTAIPVIGLAVLGLAVAFGITVAKISSDIAREENQKHKLISHYKESNLLWTSIIIKKAVKFAATNPVYKPNVTTGGITKELINKQISSLQSKNEIIPPQPTLPKVETQLVTRKKKDFFHLYPEHSLIELNGKNKQTQVKINNSSGFFNSAYTKRFYANEDQQEIVLKR